MEFQNLMIILIVFYKQSLMHQLLIASSSFSISSVYKLYASNYVEITLTGRRESGGRCWLREEEEKMFFVDVCRLNVWVACTKMGICVKHIVFNLTHPQNCTHPISPLLKTEPFQFVLQFDPFNLPWKISTLPHKKFAWQPWQLATTQNFSRFARDTRCKD